MFNMNENTTSSRDSENNNNKKENTPRKRNLICQNDPQSPNEHDLDETLVKNLRFKERKKGQIYKSQLESLRR